MNTLNFIQTQDYINRLDISDSTYEVFNELLNQPYDIFRPVMDMLFSEQISVNDLTLSNAINTSIDVLNDRDISDYNLLNNSQNLEVSELTKRCVNLLSNILPSGALIERDTSNLYIDDNGLPTSVYTPSSMTFVGNDSHFITPSLTIKQTDISGAKKKLQSDFLSVIQSSLIP
jgi:uncharacterized protein with NRDE domain